MTATVRTEDRGGIVIRPRGWICRWALAEDSAELATTALLFLSLSCVISTPVFSTRREEPAFCFWLQRLVENVARCNGSSRNDEDVHFARNLSKISFRENSGLLGGVRAEDPETSRLLSILRSGPEILIDCHRRTLISCPVSRRCASSPSSKLDFFFELSKNVAKVRVTWISREKGSFSRGRRCVEAALSVGDDFGGGEEEDWGWQRHGVGDYMSLFRTRWRVTTSANLPQVSFSPLVSNGDPTAEPHFFLVIRTLTVISLWRSR